ncbi:MAG: hypothetical protein PUH54_06835 [Oscillospiraceae bacterium]|nr:hypothetical protein [Oscillospiraceae bacterium]
MPPKCDYCHFGKRAKSGNKVLCEKSGLVDCTYSCGKFVYSPLKRIPVKQLKFAGSLADEDIYIESTYEKQLKEAQNSAKANQNTVTQPAVEVTQTPQPVAEPVAVPEPEEDINIDSIETYQADSNQYADEQDDIMHG